MSQEKSQNNDYAFFLGGGGREGGLTRCITGFEKVDNKHKDFYYEFIPHSLEMMPVV